MSYLVITLSLALDFHLWFPGQLETNKSKLRDEQEDATAMPRSGD